MNLAYAYPRSRFEPAVLVDLRLHGGNMLVLADGRTARRDRNRDAVLDAVERLGAGPLLAQAICIPVVAVFSFLLFKPACARGYPCL